MLEFIKGLKARTGLMTQMGQANIDIEKVVLYYNNFSLFFYLRWMHE